MDDSVSNVTERGVSDLSELQTVREYLRRIGASVRSMRKAVVQQHEGRYPRDVAVISLGMDGSISVASYDGGSGADFEPTAEEQFAIKLEAKAVKWPEIGLLSEIINPPPEIMNAPREAVFEFRDRDGNIRMLQVREETARGKAYIPWTYWSDGIWRKMEPDGALPLWGMENIGDNTTVFIHEGAKAARFVQRLVSGRLHEDQKRLQNHPWGLELSGAGHLGWIGGALSPHRTDWSLLAKAGVTRAYIVADNDAPGEAAVPKIAKLLRSASITITAVRFDEHFPPGFDLADDFPRTMYRGGKEARRYAGPSLIDCTTPATYATRAGQSPARVGPGRPPAPLVLRPEFIAQWVMAIVGGKTIFVERHNPARQWLEDEFNTLMCPFSDTPRLANLFKTQAYEAIVAALAYEPGQASGIITIDGTRSVNLYRPSRVVAMQGDPAPFEEFLTRLIPDAKDRWEVMRWIATLIARPSVRMHYGLLLSSEVQGVGKTTLCEILRVLVGEHNSSSPSARDVVESQFNDWIIQKTLVCINEIYEGAGWKAYNRLKTLITDLTLQANKKFMPGYSIRNWAHFVLCSNSTVALKIEAGDRRFLVPAIAEIAPPPEFWQWFHDWLDGGGYRIIASWAKSFVTQPNAAVRSGAVAPMTGRKTQLIDDSRVPEERMVLDLAAAAFEQAAATGRPVVLVDHDVGMWLTDATKRTYDSHVVRDWLKAGGLSVMNKRLKIDTLSQYVAATIDLDRQGWGELKAYRTTPASLLEQSL